MAEHPLPSRLSRLADPPAGSAWRLSGGSLTAIRLLGVAGLSWGVVASSQAVTDERRVALAIFLALVVVGYLGWTVVQRLHSSGAVLLALVLLAVGAGGLGAFSAIGIGFVALLGIVAGDHLPNRLSLGVVAVSWAALAATVAVLGEPFVLVGWAALAGAGGLMAGLNRRQFRLRAEQSEQLLRERERTAAEAEHAAALAERNRIAREVHDVLAHSLSALAVQLEALDALLGAGDLERAKGVVAVSRRLAVEGLGETRRAVHALRDAPLALAEQVAALAANDAASFRIDGEERPLPANSGLALYRAAQEALTNARRHAPGAQVSVVLSFNDDRTALSVVDEYPDGGSRPAGALSGAPGFGLTGMRERLELLGGSVTAGPVAGGRDGWRVDVEMPVQTNGSPHR
ncbi:MAG: histidine kinase [Acidimicrobiales bacterium]